MNFLKYSKLYYFISLIFLVPSIISLVVNGLNPAIDFTGGSLLEVSIDSPQSVTDESITATLDSYDIASVQTTPDSFIIRTQALSPEENRQVQDQLSSLGSVEEIRFESVGPTLGAELVTKTIFAIILASIVILSYVAYQFKDLKFGVCAILAMFHDTLIVAGIFSLLGYFYDVQVDTLFVTAVLTILSFSVHDTIVVYDRIRESTRRHSQASFSDIVNKSISETLSRSVNNSMTIIFMLTALYLLGGQTIRWFIFALLVGTITGTYSSTFVAAPLLVVWDKLAARRAR